MRNVIFYSPHFGEATLRFVTPLKKDKDINLIALCQDSHDYIVKLGVFNEVFTVEDASNQEQLEKAIVEISRNREVFALLNIHESRQLLVGRLRDKFGISGIGEETAQRFRDKALMKKIFKENGILCANYKKVESEKEVRDFNLGNSFPLILKPLLGAGCNNTFLIYDNKQFENSLKAVAITPKNPVIIEEFIEGVEGTFDAFVINGKIVFHSITTYHPTPLDAMLNSWIQPLCMFNKNIDNPEFDDIRETSKQVVDAMKVGTSMIHLEWFRRQKDGKIYVGEIAARPAGGTIIDVHNFAHDFNLFDEWSNVMLNKRFDLKPQRKWNVGSACLRAKGNVGETLKEVVGFDVVKREIGHLICGIDFPKIGMKKTDSYMGEGFIYCRGNDWNEVFNALTFATETIKFYC
ncbi:ATP-grasp domain-containing protein [bacterium]|nr:ATP-grasp domain-containing protein [bacterium]